METFLGLIVPVILHRHLCFAPPLQPSLFLRFQKPDARARRRGETLSPGEFREMDERQLTLDVEGGVGGAELLARGRVAGHAHEVAGVQLPVHGDELEVAALLEAALAALQAAAVVEPAVRHVDRVADLAAQHGAAPVQGVLGLGLPGELDGGGAAGEQNWWGGGGGKFGAIRTEMKYFVTVQVDVL